MGHCSRYNLSMGAAMNMTTELRCDISKREYCIDPDSWAIYETVLVGAA